MEEYVDLLRREISNYFRVPEHILYGYEVKNNKEVK